MRDEKMMMELFMKIAEKDERIRVMTLEGSRANINIPKDEYQDYDITFLVTELDSFIKSDEWLNIFGDIIMMQKPEAMSLFPHELGGFSFLMYFKDGIKIDLSLWPLEKCQEYLNSDPLIQVILDKDGIIPDSVVPSDESFLIKKPSEDYYRDCCNEFWHVVAYVAKGLLRSEILFANYHLTHILHNELLRMLAWKVGFETDYSISVGKNYKYMDKYISKELWQKLLDTFNLSSYEKAWEALDQIMNIFREVSRQVGKNLNYDYPPFDQAMTVYVKNLKDGHYRINNED